MTDKLRENLCRAAKRAEDDRQEVVLADAKAEFGPIDEADLPKQTEADLQTREVMRVDDMARRAAEEAADAARSDILAEGLASPGDAPEQTALRVGKVRRAMAGREPARTAALRQLATAENIPLSELKRLVYQTEKAGALAAREARTTVLEAEMPGWTGLPQSVLKRLTRDRHGEVKPTLENFKIALEEGAGLGRVLREEEGRDAAVLIAKGKSRLPWEPQGHQLWRSADGPVHALHDNDLLQARLWCDRVPGLPSMSPQDAFELIARENRYSAVADYLGSVTWDGTARLEHLLIDYCGADDTLLNREIGKRWMIGAVARAVEPGSKMDTALCLVGPQGTGKSTFFATLAHVKQWYNESSLGQLGSKESMEGLRGKWIVELAERTALRRTEMDAAKQFLTANYDTYRKPYARESVTLPRSCVFGITWNDDGSGFSNDFTGNRRFWLAKVGAIDVTRLKADTDQLWSEARVRYERSERWWFDASNPIDKQLIEMAERVVDDLAAPDHWLEIVRRFVQSRPIAGGGQPPNWTVRTTPLTVIVGAHVIFEEMGENVARTSTGAVRQISQALKREGWRRVKLKRDVPAVGLRRDQSIYVAPVAPGLGKTPDAFYSWLAQQAGTGSVALGNIMPASTLPPQLKRVA